MNFVSALRTARVLPDAPFDIARPLPQDGLARKLGVVSRLGSHIFMLHLVDFSMHKAVGGAPGGPKARRTGPLDFGGFLPSSFLRARFSLSSRRSMHSFDRLIFSFSLSVLNLAFLPSGPLGDFGTFCPEVA